MTAWDEVEDGRGEVRPHWRPMVGSVARLGAGAMQARSARLAWAADRGGAPGAWRCDLLPMVLPAAEFDELEIGLRQRARLLEALLADIYGEQRSLAEEVLPPAVLFANPRYMRACRGVAAPRAPLLHAYASDLARGPDGQWRVLADRTQGAFGVAYARETRRLLQLVIPDLFDEHQVRPLRPFFDAWRGALRQMGRASGPPLQTAILAGGPTDPHWREHVMLARDLDCAVVEAADLTVADDGVFMATRAGPQKLDLILRRTAGETLDGLDLPHAAAGTPGLLDAFRSGAVGIVNHPGAAAVEAPAFAAFMPQLCRFLLGEPLRLATLPSLWLADPGAQRTVASGFRRWALRPAFDPAPTPAPIADLDREARSSLEASLATSPWEWVGCSLVPPSTAPCYGPDGARPQPMILRLFLVFDGASWRMLPGGIARMLAPGAHAGESLPADGVFKDVWVLEHAKAPLAAATA